LISQLSETTSHLGIEPAPAPGDAGQGPAAQRGREVRSRTDDAVAQLDQGQSVSVGDQLGKHAGGCIPQFIVDMGGPFAGGSVGVRGVREEVAPALAFHGRYIERYLSTYFSPNTHLLGEAVALFFLGTFVPNVPGAARWKESGWEIVLHEAGRQVRPDGVYFEQSLYYHVYALDFFLYTRLLAARNGAEIPAAYDAVVERMLNVVAALAQAGPAEGFGDDDGGGCGIRGATGRSR